MYPNVYIKIQGKDGFYLAKVRGKNNTVAVIQDGAEFVVLVDSIDGFTEQGRFDNWKDAEKCIDTCREFTGDFDYKPFHPIRTDERGPEHKHVRHDHTEHAHARRG